MEPVVIKTISAYQKLVKTIQELSLARDLKTIIDIVRNTAVN